MAISNIKPVYPAGTFQWTDRVDNSDVNFANDINSTVAEVESLENTIGSNPQIESSVPVGLPVSYSTLSARVSDAMTNNNMPYSSIAANAVQIQNTNSGQLTSFRSVLDPYGMYNGTDITIPVNGWWKISSSAQWGWQQTGYVHHYMTLNGNTNVIDNAILDWEFSGNVVPVQYAPNGDVITPPNNIIPRFYLYTGKRRVRTKNEFQGPLHAGDRISVYLENGTNNTNATVYTVNLKAELMRIIPSSVTFTSG